jgi:hypothetical protein
MAGTQAEDRKWWRSKWGADDTLGSFNMLGPELTLRAAKLIETGKTYRLGIESTSKTPAWPPRSCEVTVMLPNQYGGATLGENHMNFFDDRVSAWMGCYSPIL